MKRSSVSSVLTSPATIAVAVAILFSIRYLNCLPFSGSTRIFNSETVVTLTSALMYVKESFSFPLGVIQHLTFPFEDANIGNVGALPLFAVGVKALGTLIPYFKGFDYFVFVDILSVFLTAFFSQRILATLSVDHVAFRALGALLTGTSFILLIRSDWFQPFCVIGFSMVAAWMYSMLLTLQRGQWKWRQDFLIISLFPVAALVDNYALWGIILGTGVILLREAFEAFGGGLPNSWNRVHRLSFLLFGGVALSVCSLYVIGMFPLPSVSSFTSYDFGMGGRYHVADIFSLWLPPATKYFPEPSLLGRLGFPFNTDHLGKGQYEGVAYVGTAVLFLWLAIVAAWLCSVAKGTPRKILRATLVDTRVILYSPWKKIGVAVLVVFIFSLGYELHIYGMTFPNFSGMPAAWIADRLPSVYNIRATGRLATLMSLFLVLEGICILHAWHAGRVMLLSRSQSVPFSYLSLVVVAMLVSVHLFEIAPLLRPVPAQPLHPLGGVFSAVEIKTLRRIAESHERVLIAPSVRGADTKWSTEAYSLAYYLGLRSNLYMIARTVPLHDLHITKDLSRIMNGDWDSLQAEYGQAIIAIPSNSADRLRVKMEDRYQEFQVGTMSLWLKRGGRNQTESYSGGGKQT